RLRSLFAGIDPQTSTSEGASKHSREIGAPLWLFRRQRFLEVCQRPDGNPVILGPEARRAKGSGNPGLGRSDAMNADKKAPYFADGISRRDLDSCDKAQE